MSNTATAEKPIATDDRGRPESAKAKGAGTQETKKVITPADIEKAAREVERCHSELLAVTRSMPAEGKRVPKGVMYDVMEGVARAAQAYRKAYIYHYSISA